MTNEHDQFAEAANQLLAILHPLLSSGIVAVRYDLGGMNVAAAPFTGPLINPLDNVGTIASKWLQMLDKATDSNGNFYIIIGEVSEPYKEPAVLKVPTAPQYHPPGERRYWQRAALDNPNPRP